MINEDRIMENAIQRELQFKQKIANLFPDHDAIDVLPLEVGLLLCVSLHW